MTVSAAFCILGEREGEKATGELISDLVPVALQQERCVDLPLGFAGRSVAAACGKPFCWRGGAQGMGFGKCSMAEPTENVSQSQER